MREQSVGQYAGGDDDGDIHKAMDDNDGSQQLPGLIEQTHGLPGRRGLAGLEIVDVFCFQREKSGLRPRGDAGNQQEKQ
jgi:hypothetical protein